MRVGKVYRALGQPFEVGRDHPRMVVERRDVVVQVVDRDKEDMGTGKGEGRRQNEQSTESEERTHEVAK